jgi:hypothetical protein
VFTPPVVGAPNGIAWWAVMLFVWVAGIELDVKQAWAGRRETVITAGLALGTPLLKRRRAVIAKSLWTRRRACLKVHVANR